MKNSYPIHVQERAAGVVGDISKPLVYKGIKVQPDVLNVPRNAGIHP